MAKAPQLDKLTPKAFSVQDGDEVAHFNENGDEQDQPAADAVVLKSEAEQVAVLLRRVAASLTRGGAVKAAAPPKYTIYFKGALGITSVTAKTITEVSPYYLSFIPVRGRREKSIQTYYSGFIAVIEGAGPTPDSPWEEETDGASTGVKLSRGRHSGMSPEWVKEIMAKIPKNRIKVLYENGKVVKNDIELAE